MRGISKVVGVLGVVASLAQPALAQRQPPPTEGVTPVTTVHPEQGYVDDAYALDGSGGRLAIVHADGQGLAEVELLDLSQKGASVGRFNLAPVTTTPTRLELVGDGSRLLVVSGEADGRFKAYLLDGGGKVASKWGPAGGVELASVNGAPAVTLFDAKPNPKGGTIFEISAFRLDNGKPLGRRSLAADAEGFISSINMTVLYWQNGYTQLVGRKQGGYDKFKDRRMNDSEGTYDVVGGVLARDTVVMDLIAWAKLLKLRTVHPNEATFLNVTEDKKTLEIITPDDKRTPVTLAEDLAHYDLDSLQAHLGRDGRVYFSLTIDPVNADAVARQKADPEYIDFYAYDVALGSARRLCRLPRGDRGFSWQLAGGHLVVLRKHKGYAHGGPDLEVYDLTAP